MATNALRTPVSGLGISTFPPSRPPSRLNLQSSFLRSAIINRNPLKQSSNGRFTCIPAIGGKSLTGLFFDSIGAELGNWPTGPALTSQFWLWLITWHLGLFLTLTFGQIGFKGRSEEYF